MTQAIALPISTTPAATTAPAAGTSADASVAGEGFAAALAQLLGTHATGTQVHAHGAKSQSTRTTATQDAQVDAATNVTPLVPGLPIQTPAQVIAAAEAASVKADKAPTLITPSTAASAGAAAAAALTAANASETATTPTATATQPQTAQAIAAAAAALTTAQATQSATPQAPATGLKAAQKAAAAKHGATPATPQRADADAQTQSLGKPAVAPSASAAQHAANENTGGNGSQLPGSKPDTTAAQLSASATPVVMTVHNTADTQTTAAATTAAPLAVPLDALAVHIARKFESGESRFEIRLDPIELGKLDISMTVAEDGRVQATVRAERPETLDMLQRDARLLENQLRQSGLNVDSNSLSFSLGGGNSNRNAFSDAGHPFGRALGLAPEIEQPTMASTIVSVRDGLDIRI